MFESTTLWPKRSQPGEGRDATRKRCREEGLGAKSAAPAGNAALGRGAAPASVEEPAPGATPVPNFSEADGGR